VALILAYPLMLIGTFFNTAIAAAASAGLQGRRLPSAKRSYRPDRARATTAGAALRARAHPGTDRQTARRVTDAGSHGCCAPRLPSCANASASQPQRRNGQPLLHDTPLRQPCSPGRQGG
jgi:hypothetical protein